MRYVHPYMNLVMTPPSQGAPKYESTAVGMSSMGIVKDTGLGELPSTSEGSIWNMSVSTIAISALVISALAFMALCVVSISRR